MSGQPLGNGRAVLDASGKATIILGPQVYGSRWNVDIMSVSGDGATQPTLNVYRDTENPRSQVDNTRNGNGDTSPTNIDLTPGQSLVFVWTGGTPGANVAVSVSGTLYTGR